MGMGMGPVQAADDAGRGGYNGNDHRADGRDRSDTDKERAENRPAKLAGRQSTRRKITAAKCRDVSDHCGRMRHTHDVDGTCLDRSDESQRTPRAELWPKGKWNLFFAYPLPRLPSPDGLHCKTFILNGCKRRHWGKCTPHWTMK